MQTDDDYTVTNTFIHHILFAARDVIGKKQLNECLLKANLERFIQRFPPDDLGESMKASEYAHLVQIIQEEYLGEGLVILHRTGRSAFQHSIQESDYSLGLVRRSIRYLKTDQRLSLILNSLAEAHRKTNPLSEVWAEVSGGDFALIDSTCPECSGRQLSQPNCRVMTGFISEAVRWAVGPGYSVLELDCRGRGDDFCRFVVERSPSEIDPEFL